MNTLNTEYLVGAFFIGLAGSLHCIGMCGPLAGAIGCAGGEKSAPRLVLFLVGKLLTYIMIGALAGAFGSTFLVIESGAKIFGALTIFAGVFMAGIGVGRLTGWGGRLISGGGGALASLLSRALSNPGRGASLVAGMLAGLLPCGLVYAAAAQSLAAGSALGGAAIMSAFGAGVTPSLFGTGMTLGLLSAKSRRWGDIAASVAVMVMGVIVVYRGALLFMAKAGGPTCH